MRTFTLIVAVALAAVNPAQLATAQQAQPVALVRVNPIENLLSDLVYLMNKMGHPEAKQEIEMFAKQVGRLVQKDFGLSKIFQSSFGLSGVDVGLCGFRTDRATDKTSGDILFIDRDHPVQSLLGNLRIVKRLHTALKYQVFR